MTMYSCGSGAMFENEECTALIWRGQNKLNGGLAYKIKKRNSGLSCFLFVLHSKLLYMMTRTTKKGVNNSMVYTQNKSIKHF